MKRKNRVGSTRWLVQGGVISLLLLGACDTARPVTPTPIDPEQRLPTPAISPQIEAVITAPPASLQGAPTVVVAEQGEVASPTPPGEEREATATPHTTPAITGTETVTATVTAVILITPSHSEPVTTTNTPVPTGTTP